MLKQLILKNFRTHEKLDLEFHKGVNVIWGLPGSGKTNILRAIDWVASNKPKFERVHSHFAKDGQTSVELILNDGDVKLTKTIKLNNFQLDNKQSFSFTGGAVPEPIARRLNLTDINNSKQLDPHFLITSTPGEVGKIINRITKIEKIDDWVSKLTTMANKTKWRIEALESECTAIEQDLKHYDGLEDLEKRIIKFQKMEDRASEILDTIHNLTILCDQIDNLESRINELKSLDLDKALVDLEKSLTLKTTLSEKYLNIVRKAKQYSAAWNTRMKLQALVDVIRIDGLEELINDLQEKYRSNVFLNLFKKQCQNMFTKQEKVKVAKASYLKAISDLGICPVCMNSISIEHIHNLEAEL